MALPVAGPSTPPTSRAKQDNITTSGPAHENHSQAQADGNDSDSSDDFMPTLPPNFAKPKPAPAAPIGPKLPAGYAVSEARHTGDDVSDHGDDPDDDDDDDVAGPAPLPAHLSSSLSLPNEGVIALREREERQKEMDRIERESKVLKRDEWMLLPPKEFDLKTAIDPTKIKARGFKQTSKPHASSTEGSRTTASSSLWTETPAERSQRLADEAIGKRRRAEEVAKGGAGGDDDDDLEASKRKKRDHLMRQQVDQHNKSLRNASLLDLHKTANTNVSNSKTRSEKESDRKQKVVWDHDAMMGVNSKLLSDNQKANMINDAKGLGGRFGGGSFL